MADWSTLPCDVLGEIALKLDQIEAFIYFSAVCHSWNRASSLVKSQWNTNTNIMPWMLLTEPKNTNNNPECLRKVYNLSNRKSYHLKLPETFGARCWGSRYGWIVMQNYNSMFEVHLFNPLTEVRITSLPSLLTLPHTPKDPLRNRKWFFHHFVTRFVVLKLPHSHLPNNSGDDDYDGDLLIAAFYGEFEYLAFARPGDKSWIDIEEFTRDVFCWGDVIYVVRCDGELLYCDIRSLGVGGSDHPNKEVEVLEYVPACRQICYHSDKVTLLDLCGSLLMVIRHKKCKGNEEFTTVAFTIYELDNKIKKWVAINDLGNFAIFVGNNSSMSVRVSAANNWMKNCIYFTEDEVRPFFLPPGDGGKDMGVYNIMSGDITQFYEGDDTTSPFCPTMLFVPWLK